MRSGAGDEHAPELDEEKPSATSNTEYSDIDAIDPQQIVGKLLRAVGKLFGGLVNAHRRLANNTGTSFGALVLAVLFWAGSWGVGLGLITHGLPPYILANPGLGLIAGALGVLYLPYFTYLNVTAICRSESGSEPTRAWPLLVGVTFGWVWCGICISGYRRRR